MFPVCAFLAKADTILMKSVALCISFFSRHFILTENCFISTHMEQCKLHPHPQRHRNRLSILITIISNVHSKRIDLFSLAIYNKIDGVVSTFQYSMLWWQKLKLDADAAV